MSALETRETAAPARTRPELDEPWSPDRAASNGAVFLDEQRPGWADEIDPETLSIDIACKCVLGQTYGNFWKGCNVLHLDGDPRTPRIVNLGFNLDGLDRARYMDILTAAWKREILARRAP